MSHINWIDMARPSDLATDNYIALLEPKFRQAYEAEKDPNSLRCFGGRVVLSQVPIRISPDYEDFDLTDPVIEKADNRLREIWPEVWEQFGRLICAYHPIQKKNSGHDMVSWGCVCGQNWETEPLSMYVGFYGRGGLMDGWVHELGHVKLHSIGIHLEDWNNNLILNSPEEGFVSCVRKDKPRPMGAVIHALYSYMHVTEVQLRSAKNGDVRALDPLRVNVLRLVEGIPVIDAGFRGTTEGQEFWHGMSQWATTLIAEVNDYLRTL